MSENMTEIVTDDINQPLWMFTNYVSMKVFNYDLNSFRFVPEQLPLSTNKSVFIALAIYYTTILTCRWVMKYFEPLRLKKTTPVHNLFLCLQSLVLLALMTEQVVPTIYHHGLFYSICAADSFTQHLTTLYYINYIMKFVELTDTLVLCFKKKKLTFLHTYHHGATALLCYTQLLGKTSISWVCIGMNLFVHVMMYYYYFLSSRGIRVSWKVWVTRVQIIQFIVDVSFIYFAVFNKLCERYMPSFPHTGSCVGSFTATVAGSVIITSYLFLFISFYIGSYIRPKKTSKKNN